MVLLVCLEQPVLGQRGTVTKPLLHQLLVLCQRQIEVHERWLLLAVRLLGMGFNLLLLRTNVLHSRVAPRLLHSRFDRRQEETNIRCQHHECSRSRTSIWQVISSFFKSYFEPIGILFPVFAYQAIFPFLSFDRNCNKKSWELWLFPRSLVLISSNLNVFSDFKDLVLIYATSK